VKHLLLLVFFLFSATAVRTQHLESYEPFDPYARQPKEYVRYFTKWFVPPYPERAQNFHKTGSGSYRLTINPQTGAVTQVQVVKSTGVKILDDCAAVCFMQWKAKPHTLGHATIAMTFEPPRERTGSHIVW
jgi:TonB family protein